MTNRMISSVLTIALLALGSTFAVAEDSDSSFDEKFRTWKSSDGKHEVTATLVGYSDRKATLELSDGQTIAVSVDKLSSSDRSYLATKLPVKSIVRKRMNAEAVKELPERAESTALVADPVDKNEDLLDREEIADELYGIEWYNQEDSQQLAIAKERPIMWFRVLGDLTGFM